MRDDGVIYRPGGAERCDILTDAFDALFDRRDSHSRQLCTSILDRETHTIPEKLPPSIPGQRPHDRPYGEATPLHHVSVHRATFALGTAADRDMSDVDLEEDLPGGN